MNYSKYNQTVIAYSYDQNTGAYTGFFDYFWAEGTGLAANSTLIAPPSYTKDKYPCFNEDTEEWILIDNLIGQNLFSTKTQEKSVMTNYGAIPNGYTLKAPNYPYETWDGEQWADQRTTAQKRDAFLATLRPLSRRQFKLILLKKKLLKKVEQLISEIEDETQQMQIQIEYEESTEFVRTSDAVLYMCQLLQLTDEQIDSMWQEAMNL